MVIERGDIYVTRGETREKWLYRFGGENERGRRWRDVRGLFGTLELRNAAFGHRVARLWVSQGEDEGGYMVVLM